MIKMPINNIFMWVIDASEFQKKSAIKSIEHFLKNNKVSSEDKILVLTDEIHLNEFENEFSTFPVEFLTFESLYNKLEIKEEDLNTIKGKAILYWMLVPFIFNEKKAGDTRLFVFDNDTLSNIDPENFYNDTPITGKSIFDFTKNEFNDLTKFKNHFHNDYIKLSVEEKNKSLKQYEKDNWKIAFRQTMPIRLMGIDTWEEYEKLYSYKCNGGFWVVNLNEYLSKIKNLGVILDAIKTLSDFYISNDYPLWKISDEEVVFFLFRKDITLIKDDFINFYPSNVNMLQKVNSKYLLHFAGFQCKKLWNELLNEYYIDPEGELFRSLLQNASKLESNLWIRNIDYKKRKLINEWHNDYLGDLFLKDSQKCKITLLVTVFKPTPKECKFWANIYNNWKGDTFFLIDNPSFDISKLLSFGVQKEDVFENKENVGKLKTILNFLKKNIIKTTHFKICDPDDFISLEDLEKAESLIKIKWKNELINFRGSSIVKSRIRNSQKFVSKYIQKHSYTNTKNMANHQMILPVLPYTDFNYEFTKRVNSTDDKILALIALLKGSTIKSIDKQFYLYRRAYGESNNKNSSVFLENCIISYDEMFKLMKKMKTKSFDFDLDGTRDWFIKKFNSDNDIEIINKVEKILDSIKKMENILSDDN